MEKRKNGDKKDGIFLFMALSSENRKGELIFMSMRKILRRIAKAEMKRAGIEKINRRISGNTWRRVVNAWPMDQSTGKPMRHGYIGRKDNKPINKAGHGKLLFMYENKFGPTPPRKRFNKETGRYYLGHKVLGKVASEEVSVNEAG